MAGEGASGGAGDVVADRPSITRVAGVRRLAASLALAVVVAACGSEDAPTIDPGAGGAAPSSTAPATSTTAATPVSADVEPQSLQLALTGDAEVPGPGSDGTAEATLTYDGDELCLEGTTTGVGPLTNGHIHAGPAGASGPVVVDFAIRTDADGPFRGCARVGAEGGVVFVDPAAYYVNLHTAEFPDGAVRAQLG